MISKKIAILFHERDRQKLYHRYMITKYADIWRRDGLEVEYVFGTSKFVPADLAILHIDLSVVSEQYLAFAQQYPKVLNGKIKDIRKSSFSKIIIGKNDAYDGKVIVKTNLNAAGMPEWKRRTSLQKLSSKLLQLISNSQKSIKPAKNYKVYKQFGDVPQEDIDNPDMIIEKFIPEIEEDYYFIRTYLFFGDRMSCHRLRSTSPVVKSHTVIDFALIDPHPDVVAMTKKLHFDFGKFDYVVHHGKPIIFDINKTPGSGSNYFKATPEINEMRRRRAEGLYAYFD